jgi:hypothetical protein
VFAALADLRRRDAEDGGAGHKQVISVAMSGRNRKANTSNRLRKRRLAQSGSKRDLVKNSLNRLIGNRDANACNDTGAR